MSSTVLVPAGSGKRVVVYAAAFVAGYRSANTRRSYATALRQWLSYCGECHVDPLTARRPQVEAFARHYERRGCAGGTVKRKLGTLAMFYKWLVDEGFAAVSPMTNVRRPKAPAESTRLGLGRTELCDWLDAAGRLAARITLLPVCWG